MELPRAWLYARIHTDKQGGQGLAKKLGMRGPRKMEARQAKLDDELLVFWIRI